MSLPKNANGCPYLLLAPMEGLGDLPFRKAMASVGGMDQACTEFLRVPTNAHVPSLARRYHANDLLPVPQAVQIMGSNPELMAAMTKELVDRKAPRIDLNCGCPSNTVTGKGAGSSLLKEPNLLYKIAKAMVEAAGSVPVTAKLRIGYTDTSLFKENILAAQESGIQFLTLHPRTKVDGYGPPARWEFIAEAKQILKIPVVGNGDILTVQDALKMLQMTKCDALMIGRGSVSNPFIFQEIKAYFSGQSVDRSWPKLIQFIEAFICAFSEDMPIKSQVNKLKHLMGCLFKANPELLAHRQHMLTTSYSDARHLLQIISPLLKEYWH